MISRESCAQWDSADSLASLRDQFEVTDGTIYLDGNSLGALPRSVGPRLQQVIDHEWGTGLIRSWNSAGWMQLPFVIGDKISRLIGAGRGDVVVADSTSVNLYKVLMAAVAERDLSRSVILSELDNFPTDAYIASAVADATGMELRLVKADEIMPSLDDSVAVLLLTHVSYRTGALHDMGAITACAHEHGSLAIWDLAHSAGVIEVDLTGTDADLAVGCGYKYLNGGPGAPAFVWVNPRHSGRFRQPLTGWMGHEAPFEFATAYRPAPGIARFLCGTPPILSLAALECGVDTVLAAEPFGGVAAIRRKSSALTDLFLELVRPVCTEHGFSIATTDVAQRRGSQISLTHPDHGYEIMQALIARGVIGDFREPDVLRFGFAPLYIRFVDVFDAVHHLRSVMADAEWKEPRFAVRAAVT